MDESEDKPKRRGRPPKQETQPVVEANAPKVEVPPANKSSVRNLSRERMAARLGEAEAALRVK